VLRAGVDRRRAAELLQVPQPLQRRRVERGGGGGGEGDVAVEGVAEDLAWGLGGGVGGDWGLRIATGLGAAVDRPGKAPQDQPHPPYSLRCRLNSSHSLLLIAERCAAEWYETRCGPEVSLPKAPTAAAAAATGRCTTVNR